MISFDIRGEHCLYAKSIIYSVRTLCQKHMIVQISVTKLIWFAAVCTLLNGCTITKVLKNGEDPESEHFISTAKYLREAGDRRINIALRDGSGVHGRLASLDSDTVQIVTGDSVPCKVSYAMHDVATLEYAKPAWGALEGFIVGSIGGAILGAYYLDVGNDRVFGKDVTGIGKEFFIGASFVFGGLSGSVIGSIIGHHERAVVSQVEAETSSNSLFLPQRQQVRPIGSIELQRSSLETDEMLYWISEPESTLRRPPPLGVRTRRH